jgi:hypothetical protein
MKEGPQLSRASELLAETLVKQPFDAQHCPLSRQTQP